MKTLPFPFKRFRCAVLHTALHRSAGPWLLASVVGAALVTPGCDPSCEVLQMCPYKDDGSGDMAGAAGALPTGGGGKNTGDDGGSMNSGANDGSSNGGSSSSVGGSGGDAGGADGFDASGGGAAGAGGDSEAGGLGGAGGEPPRCNPNAPFDAPVVVPTLSDADDYDATLTSDGLTIIVWRTDESGKRLYSATRKSPDGLFGELVQDALLASANWFRLSQGYQGYVDVPSISGDGLELYADFGGQGLNYIWTSERPSLSEVFQDPVAVEELGDTVRTAPFISFDRQTLYFSQEGAIHFARRADSGFQVPVQIPSLLSPEPASSPVVRQDETTLYFASARPDGTAKGESDVWVSRRPTVEEDFGLPSAVAELNSSAQERPVWISEDGCEIFIIRQTSEFSHVLVARRPL